jgi:hypothetical protein
MTLTSSRSASKDDGNGSRWNKKRMTSIMSIMSLNYASLFVNDYSFQVPSYQDNVREKKE